MINISEFVSIGHPDKIADYISQYLLDRYIEIDPLTRYAVEVQIKDNIVTLGGEVSSTVVFALEEITKHVRDAIGEIGYTKEYREKWGQTNTICNEDLLVDAFIRQQSKDIAQGLDGWGDQGIFFGFATPTPETSFMPLDHHLAKKLCKELFDSNIGGLDIKTQIEIDGTALKRVIVAIPLLEDNNTEYEAVIAVVNRVLAEYGTANKEYELIINGTGRYLAHSSVADCGTTGRKLVVDFYGGNSRIGGGSPWTKDGSKADLTLNLYARELAKHHASTRKEDIQVAIACAIGKQEVLISVSNSQGVISEEYKKVCPQKLINRYKLNTPIYASMCRWGLFGKCQIDKNWE